MSSPPNPGPFTEQQLAGIACAECGATGCPLFSAGTVQQGGGGKPVRVYPVMKCRTCMPDRQMIVIASSADGAR